MRIILSIGVILALLVAACVPAAEVDDSEDALLVVATTSILGDVVSAVTGPEARVEVLIPAGADPHDYLPSPAQVALLEEADLVVANGLGLEEGLADVVDAAAGRVLELGPALDPRPLRGGSCEGGEGCDPHVWLDPIRMKEGVGLIAGALAEMAPQTDWESPRDAYIYRLEEAHRDIGEILAGIPPERRLVVTSHDFLGYFADRYRLEVVGAVAPGGSTMAQPSAAHLAELLALIDARNIPAVFVAIGEPAPLAAAVAAEAKGTVDVVELYVGSLGEPGSGAETLIGLLITDAQRIAGALAGRGG